MGKGLKGRAKRMQTGFSLLVAEDNADDRFLLQTAFSMAEIEESLYFVTDGLQAIEFLKGAGKFKDRKVYPVPSMLLLDLMMPRVDGFEVLEWIKAQPLLRRLVVIIFTGSDLEADVNRAYDLGANGYLVKTDLKRLRALVKEIHAYWREQNKFGDCQED